MHCVTDACGQSRATGGGGGGGGGGAAAILVATGAVALPARSVIVTVAVAALVAVGVPEMTPVCGSSPSPPASPVAVNVAGPVRASSGASATIGWLTWPINGP